MIVLIVLGVGATCLLVLFLLAAGLAVEDVEPEDGIEEVFPADNRFDLLLPLQLEVGDCLRTDLFHDEIPPEVVPCAEEHELELYARPSLTELGSDHPGTGSVSELADERCSGDAFTEFIGEPVEQASLEYEVAYPDRPAWEDGHHFALCFVSRFGTAPSKGSLEGFRR